MAVWPGSIVPRSAVREGVKFRPSTSVPMMEKQLEILDLRTLLPLDEEAIATTVRRTNRVIILHEDTKTGGIAGEISAIINERAFDDLDGPIIRITARDTPVPFSPPLEEYFLPKVEDIVREARRLKAY